jgi:hypothetical protein
MQKSISRTARTWRYILAGFLIVSLISCEEENSVGGEFIGGSNLKFDTLFVDNFTPQNDVIFSGNLQYAPVGIYNDPLFGTTKSIAFIKPQIRDLNVQGEVDDNYQLKLELKTNSDITSGNTLSSVNFDIFPVNEFWRGNEVVSNDAISIDSTRSFGSFTHFGQDSLVIDLSDDLLLELATYINNDSTTADSLYDFDFDGMAIVPRAGGSRIIFPDMFESRFFIISPDEDTTRFVTKSHAFNLERSNANNYPNRLYINSYFENFYSLSFESALPDYDQINLLKAEFVVYEDVNQLNNSLPNFHTRAAVNSLELKSGDAANLRYELQFTGTDFFGAADSLNDGFRFDLTEHINQYLFTEPDEKTLYFNLNPSGGVMRSTLLYDQTSVDSLRPKLILTFSE